MQVPPTLSRRRIGLRAVHAIVLLLAATVATVTAWDFDHVQPAQNGSSSNARVSVPQADQVHAEAGAGSVLELTRADAAATLEGGDPVGNVTRLASEDYVITTRCQGQQWRLRQKRAAAMWLEFSALRLADGDQLVLKAANGKEVPVNASEPPVDEGRIRSPTVPGSEAVLEYRPSPTCSGATSFNVTGLGIKFAKEWLIKKEAVCGAANTMKNVKCFESNGDGIDKKMYERSRAVLRTERTREDGKIVVCTAWLWGNKGHLVTNSHCFSSQAMVDASEFHFGVENPTCDGKCQPGSCPIGRAVKGSGGVKFMASDSELDVALLQLTKDATDIIAKYGYLQIRFGKPELGEEIYVPQHPGGGARMIAKTDDDGDKTIGTIKQIDISVKVDSTTHTHLIGYSLDTESGSSGSPVITRKGHHVVGLHRIGLCNNAATPSIRLLNFLVHKAGQNDGLII